MRRRNFLIFSIGVLSGWLPKKLFARVNITVFKKNKIPVSRNTPITPPGSGSIFNYTKNCIDCELCAIFCPSSVIKQASFSYKGKAFKLPLLNNTSGYCNYKCTICGEVCPTDAISRLLVDEKKKTQIGKVKFIRENCITTLQGTDCGACAEHCPTKAVSMVPDGNIRIPKIAPDVCVGCGACEYICPAIPNKAIYVEGNETHQKITFSKKKQNVKEDILEEFPF